MGKNDESAVKPKQFSYMALNIVETLVELGFLKEVKEVNLPVLHGDTKHAVILFQNRHKSKVVEAVAEAIKRSSTFGNLGTMTLRNNKGQIVAKLYILPDGTLADDSWICNKGWK